MFLDKGKLIFLRSACAAFAFLIFLLCVAPFARPQSTKRSATVPAATPDPAMPHGQIEYLWPHGAPDAIGAEEQDKPHFEIFSGYGTDPHAAVIVCPGGSYTHLGYEKEGVRVAEWLNLRGITAFVLTYRLSPRYHYPDPILDGYRAVRWVRSHASEYNVAPDRIGMWGFSAGGHLVAMVGTHFDEGNPKAADPIDRISDRPDFVVSSYGVLTLQPEIVKPKILGKLTGDNPQEKVMEDLSPDKYVTSKSPPFFLYATTTDQSVPVLSTVTFYSALVRAGFPAEMHVFQAGLHGTGLGQFNSELAEWPTLLENWLRLNGWIPFPSASAVH